MNKLWVRGLVSALLLGIAVPMYFAVYLVMLFLWENANTSNDVIFAYAVGLGCIAILLPTNYFALSLIFRDMPRLRRVLVSVVIMPVAFYVMWFLLLPRQSSYHGCNEYTKYMNGGVHAFEGRNYKIELCGLDGVPGRMKNWGRPDEIRLKMLSVDGELLAERFFRPADDRASPLKYGDNSLTYSSSTAHMNQQEKITVPPSHWEWIRARLPRMWP